MAGVPGKVRNKKRVAKDRNAKTIVKFIEKWRKPEREFLQPSRRSEYSSSFPQQLAKLVDLGLSLSECATYFGTNVNTFQSWLDKHPEMMMAWAQTQPAHDADVVAALFKRATGFTVDSEKIFCTADGEILRVMTETYYPPDVTAATFWLRTRRPDSWNKVGSEDPNRAPAPVVIQMQIQAAKPDEDRSYRLDYDIDAEAVKQ